jgi:anti-sigma28 factor (negative regulator of flagellin synthesis)
MPDISSIGPDQLGPVNRVTSGPSLRTGEVRQAPGEDRRAETDRVELSPHARFLNALRSLPGIRADRVEQVREAIASETYETDEKVDIAVSRVMDEISK